jgi:hypothetical protein
VVVGICGADELRRAGHGGYGGRWPDGRKKDRDCNCGDAGDREPFDLKSTHEIRRYPFDGNLVKEPLHFLEINPWSQGVKLKFRFCILKTYFHPVKSKIRFQQFTVLPLELF